MELRGEPLAIDVALSGAQTACGLDFSVLLELNVGSVLSLLGPVGKACGVGVAGFGEVGPIGFDEIGELHVDVCEVSGDISGFGEVAEDVGQVGRMNGALRFLTGNGVIEFILPRRIVRGLYASAACVTAGQRKMMSAVHWSATGSVLGIGEPFSVA